MTGVLPRPFVSLLAEQSGVVSRSQLLGLGARPHDLARWQRRRELVTVHPGVYVDHTGSVTWWQAAWAAVLATAPSALCGESAVTAATGPSTHAGRRPIHVAVAATRHLRTPEGVVVRRMRDLDAQVLWQLAPPRQRLEDAVLDVALDSVDTLGMVAAITEAVGARRTTAARLLEASRRRARVPGRGLLEGVLRDVAVGTGSVLEHGYLTLVERAHGLPVGDRQQAAWTAAGKVYRDVVYGDLVVELDGRLHHDNPRARDRDMERDLATALIHRTTVRLSWGQVFDRPCETAETLARLLAHGGWTGSPRVCGPECARRSGTNGPRR